MHQHAGVLILVLALGADCSAPRTAGSEHGLPAAPGASGLEPTTAPSPALAKRLSRARERIGLAASGARVLAAAADVPVLERHGLEGGRLVRYLREPRALVVDPARAKRAPPRELELALVREGVRALADQPVSLVEDEQAAFQAELEYAVDAADLDGDFDERLRESFRQAEAAEGRRRRRESWVRSAGVEPGVVLDPRAARGAMERLGAYLYLFSESPEEFYAIVEREQTDPRGAVRLAELNDFMALHSKRLGELKCAGSRYCWLDGRSYPRKLGQAAQTVGDLGRMRQVRERVGVFQTVALPALVVKVNRWVRGEKP